MKLIRKNKPKFIWVLGALILCTSLVFLASFVSEKTFGAHHRNIMLGAFFLFIFLIGFLLTITLKALRLQEEKIEELMGIKLVLTSLIDLKDPYTEGHSRHVRDLARSFSEYLKLPPETIEEIVLAAELHDIGKIGLPDSILKKPGRLAGEEREEVKKHPSLGAEALRSLQGFDTIAGYIRHHHEIYDGTGYPDGLKGDEIPLGSRIISIVDVYDALIHGRSYRPPLTRKETLEFMENEMGSHFDPDLLSSFKKFLKNGKDGVQYDPVCGMTVTSNSNEYIYKYQNQDFLFCSEICLKEFQRSPEKYKNLQVKPLFPAQGRS